MPDVDLAALYAAFETRPFPGSWRQSEYGALGVHSNPAGHAIVLAESGDFYDDHDGSASRAAWDRLEPVHREYQAAARELWGDARKADFLPRLAQDGDSPLADLVIECGSVTMDFWTPGGRMIGVVLSQMDKEQPVQVVALVMPPADPAR